MANHHCRMLSERHCRKRTAIVQLTQAHAQNLDEADRTSTDDELDKKDPMRLVRRMRGRELRLIQGQDIIRGEGLSTRDESVGNVLVETVLDNPCYVMQQSS
jgi:hypothetical protein